MISDFSAESALHQIYDARTKAYMDDVLKCHSIGAYRAAIVMLWTVAVADLVFKLEQLAQAYADPIAQQILTNIRAQQQANPNSPAWEADMVTEVRNRTQMLEAHDHANLVALQRHRHLCAHPVLGAALTLFEPNPETSRAHIRNVLDGVLTKPPVYGRRVFDDFTNDVIQLAPALPQYDQLKRYLEAKYFPHFRSEIEDYVFRNLWRITFRSQDATVELHRLSLLRAVYIMFDRRSAQVLQLIATDAAYYSDLHMAGRSQECLFGFLRDRPQAYALLTDAVKVPMDQYARADNNRLFQAWYLHDVSQVMVQLSASLQTYQWLTTTQTVRQVVDHATQQGRTAEALNLCVEAYGHSDQYDRADEAFDLLIRPFLAAFNAPQLLRTVTLAEGNSQTTDRRLANRDHHQLAPYIQAASGGQFNFQPYPRFAATAV